ncbi:MAG: leucyl aminopeptidase [Rhodospirillaceae bacterium]|nr:leucyl aminopeptidase [Rhodospirillaceae bacterium]|tara:strand:+ start:7334 stop:8722 length:1389 start_codon:yes stop_codon:yes gene_type:complete
MVAKGLIDSTDDATPLVAVTSADYPVWLETQHSRVALWLRRTGFKAEAGAWRFVPAVDGGIALVVVCLGEANDIWAVSDLPMALPDDMVLTLDPASDGLADAVAQGWAAGCYSFSRYKTPEREPVSLVWPESCDRNAVSALIEAMTRGRDLVNTPAEDMGPADLGSVAEDIAEQHEASVEITLGETLLSANYPAIHAVGRASSRPPCLIDLHWGAEDAPMVTLVGKGVCFDTGGHDLKGGAGMLRMKKDMGGAACALAVAGLVMAHELPVRLRVLIPAVDNALDGNALRPMDIVTTRKGVTIEIGDTDAEGRVILADALAAAVDDKPELLIDFATLTGAARVALGMDLPACFSNVEELSADLCDAGRGVDDPLWPVPLVKGYLPRMASDLADINTIADWGFADHIQAALFLQKFVGDETPWLHIDTVCWNQNARPGRPRGGEIQGARAVFAMLQQRYGTGAE